MDDGKDGLGVRSASRQRRRALLLAGAIALAGCADDDMAFEFAGEPAAGLRTLAYVVTECREGRRRIFASQKLVVRRANGTLATVKEFPVLGPMPPLGFCELYAETRFGTGEPSQAGCTFFPLPGCGVTVVGHEPADDTVLFLSNCDPLGTNPNGGQIFSMRFDGTELRQLTSMRAVATEADGTVVAELPGPVAYPTAWP